MAGAGGTGVVGAAVNRKGICCQEGPSVALHVMQRRAHHVWGLGKGSRVFQKPVGEGHFRRPSEPGRGCWGTVWSQWRGHHGEVGKREDRQKADAETGRGTPVWAGYSGGVPRLEGDTGWWKPCSDNSGFSLLVTGSH